MHAEPLGLRGAQVGNLWSKVCLLLNMGSNPWNRLFIIFSVYNICNVYSLLRLSSLNIIFIKTSFIDADVAMPVKTCLKANYMIIFVKVKFSRYRPGVAQRVGRGIALIFHDRGTRRR